MSDAAAAHRDQDGKIDIAGFIHERNENIKSLYFEDGLSVLEVKKRVGVSESLIKQIIREVKQTDPERAARRVAVRYDRRKMVNREVLSGTHSKLGMMISRHLSTHNMNPTEFGVLVGMTRNQVSELVAGSWDVTLTQAMTLCRVLKYDIRSLFEGVTNGPVSGTPTAATTRVR